MQGLDIKKKTIDLLIEIMQAPKNIKISLGFCNSIPFELGHIFKFNKEFVFK